MHRLRPFVVLALPILATVVWQAGCGSSGTASNDAGASSSSSSGGSDGGGGGDGGSSQDANSDAESGDGKFADVAAGVRSTCVVYKDGRLFCFGGNDSGQLGYGDKVDRGGEAGSMAKITPVDLGPSVTAKQVVVGDSHACALLGTSDVKCWGSNEQGQLGQEDNVSRGALPGQMGAALAPIKLGTGKQVKKLAAGTDFTCALLVGGSVKCWGRNVNGQLGQGITAIYVGRDAGTMGDALPEVSLGTGRTAVDIGAGEQHACALLDNGLVKCWGGNTVGQLGIGDTSPRGRKADEMGDALNAIDFGSPAMKTTLLATALYVGPSHNCVKLADDSIKCWGGGSSGALGLGNKTNYGATPETLGQGLPALAFGANESVVSMHLGGSFTCAKLKSGALKCFGLNESGQLGYGDTSNRGDTQATIPSALPAVNLAPFGDGSTGHTLDMLATGEKHVCGAFSDRSLRCWGSNVSGQLGRDDRKTRGTTPGDMGAGLSPTQLP